MKKHLAWLLILFLGITIGCKTVPEPETVYIKILPDYTDPPIRKEVEAPKSVQDMATIIVYYEELLSEWESWGILVYKAVDLPLPASLQSILNAQEE